MTTLQLRRDTAAHWASVNPIPHAGEPCWDETNMQMRVGDGTSHFVDLDPIGGGDYQPHDADLDAIAALTTTSYGRSFLALANSAAAISLVGAPSGTAPALPTVGATMLTNGTFTGSATGWTLAGSATYSANAVSVINGSTVAQTITPTTDKCYLIEWTDTLSSGTITVTLGAISSGPIPFNLPSRVALYCNFGTAMALQFAFTGSGTLDDVTIKEIIPSTAAIVGGVEVRHPTLTDFALGTNAQLNLGGANSQQNIAIGYDAQRYGYEGAANIGIGYEAQKKLAYGQSNVAVGTNAQSLMNGGYHNVAIGSLAMQSSAQPTQNVAIGSSAGQSGGSQTDNVWMGYAAGQSSSGAAGNIGIGTSALNGAGASVGSIAIGYLALSSQNSGGTNIAIGYQSGISGFTTSAGLRQVLLGHQTGQSVTGAQHDIIAVGFQARAGALGAIALGSGAVSSFAGAVAIGMSTAATAIDQIKIGARHIELTEMTGPAAGATNNARLYAVDNGAGKTQLAVRFPTGAVVVLATEP